MAQEINDGSGAVIWNHATDFGGARLYDFTPGGASQRYIGTNGHGDVTWTADSTGSVVSTARYDPFGATLATSGTVPDSRWQGSWLDTSVGLYYVQARWYAPDLGRFLSTDPAAGSQQSPQTLDPYAYGAGDSVGRIDTDGRCYVTSSDYGACDTAAKVTAADAAAKANLAAYERRAQALADAARAKAAADAAAARAAQTAAAEAEAARHKAATQAATAQATSAATSGCHPDNAQWADLCAIHGSDAAVAAALASQEAVARSREEARAAAEFASRPRPNTASCRPDNAEQAQRCAGTGSEVQSQAEVLAIRAFLARQSGPNYVEVPWTPMTAEQATVGWTGDAPTPPGMCPREYCGDQDVGATAVGAQLTENEKDRQKALRDICSLEGYSPQLCQSWEKEKKACYEADPWTCGHSEKYSPNGTMGLCFDPVLGLVPVIGVGVSVCLVHSSKGQWAVTPTIDLGLGIGEGYMGGVGVLTSNAEDVCSLGGGFQTSEAFAAAGPGISGTESVGVDKDGHVIYVNTVQGGIGEGGGAASGGSYTWVLGANC